MPQFSKLVNLARMTVSSVPGTGALALLAAADGYITFAQAGIVNGDVVTYSIRDLNKREVGKGTYNSTGPALSRDTILASTNNNAAVNFSTANAQVAIVAAAENFPTRDDLITVLTSGSGTHNFTAGCKMMEAEAVGGGGGGGGSGTTGVTAGGNGGNTTFGTLTANGGAGGLSGGSGAGSPGGAGGTTSGGDINIDGAVGCGCSTSISSLGNGGSSFFGGSGPGGTSAANIAGTAAKTNSGSGGGGAGGSGTVAGGRGGGAGGYARKFFTTVINRAYAVGAAGTAGAAGTGGAAGAAGGAGLIWIRERF